MQRLCACGHDYGAHGIRRAVENSLAAMALPGADATESVIDALPEDVEHEALGGCTRCRCHRYVPAPSSHAIPPE